MRYQYRDRNRFGVEAQVAGDRLEEIRQAHDGFLDPHDVVDDARPNDAPLHPAFEWDDARAAEEHRRRQAAELIRSVRVVHQGDDQDEPDRREIAYVSVKPPEGGPPRYVTAATALSDEDLRRQVLDDAIRALEQLRARFGHLTELAEVFQAIDDLGDVGV